MNFLLSVLFILFLGQEKYHSAEATALNNTTTNKFMFLSDGKYCRLFPKWMKANHSLSECDINVEEYKYWVEGFLLAIVSFVGILGNFASCIKFAKCQIFYTEQILKLNFISIKMPKFSALVSLHL